MFYKRFRPLFAILLAAMLWAMGLATLVTPARSQEGLPAVQKPHALLTPQVQVWKVTVKRARPQDAALDRALAKQKRVRLEPMPWEWHPQHTEERLNAPKGVGLPRKVLKPKGTGVRQPAKGLNDGPLSLKAVMSLQQENAWTPASPGMVSGEVWDVVISPDFAHDNLVFAATTKGGVYKSSDRGDTWAPSNAGLTAMCVYAIALSPQFTQDGIVYVGTSGGGVFRSEDRGETWTPMNTGLTNLNVNAIALSPAFPADATLFAGTTEGLFRSADGGATWSFVADIGPLNVERIAISPNFAVDRIAFVATSLGVFKTTDAGTTWQKVLDVAASSVTVSPMFPSDGKVFVGSADFYMSQDRGVSWEKQGDFGALFGSILDIEVSPNFVTDNTIYISTASGVFKTADDGQTWTQIMPSTSRGITVSPDISQDGTMFSASLNEGMYRSTDGGHTWELINVGLIRLTVTDIAVSPNYSNDHTVYMSTQQNGVFKSVDEGVSWTKASNGITNNQVEALAISPQFPSDATLFAGTAIPGGLFKTSDGGNTWNKLIEGEVNSIGIPPTYPGDPTVFFGGMSALGSGIHVSRDGGDTWSFPRTGDDYIYDFAFSPNYAADGTVFAASMNGWVLKSQDRGVTWRTHLVPGGAYSLGISPAYPQDLTVFAGALGEGIFKSTDGGETWQQQNNGLDTPQARFVRDIFVSPNYATDQTVYIATDAGVYRSTDGGGTWRLTGLDTFQVLALGYSPPASPAYLLGGTRDEGLWKYEIRPCYDFVSPTGVGAEDVIYVAQRWRMTSNDPGWVSQLDVNGDNVINVLDVLAVAANVGTTCP